MHRSSLITLFFYIYGEKAFVAAGTPADIALIIPLLELAPALAMLSSWYTFEKPMYFLSLLF